MQSRGIAAFVLIGLSLSAPSSAASASLEIVGTGDGIDVLEALGSAFAQREHSVHIEVPPSIGSGGGVAAIGSGKAILGRVARKLSAAEIAAGINYKPVARLPAAFFVNRSSGITNLSTEQLLAIYSGHATNWKEVGGADLRVRVVRRENSDSTLTVLRAAMPGWKDLEITEKSKTATTTQEAIQTVREVPGAIGFGPFSKSLEKETNVLAIDGRYPTNPEYPSSVELAVIYKDSTVTPEAVKFLEFLQTPHARKIIENMGNIPAP